MPIKGIPPWLVPVLNDLDATTDVELVLEDRLELDGGPISSSDYGVDIWLTSESARPGAVGITVYPGETDVSQQYRAAEVVQEFVIENHVNVWPQCPRHPNHPLWADFDEVGVWWTCERDTSIRIPLGSLGQPHT